jgi:hypothetical protein
MLRSLSFVWDFGGCIDKSNIMRMTQELREVVKGGLLVLLRFHPEGIEDGRLYSEMEKQWRQHLLAPPSWIQFWALLEQLRREGKVKCRANFFRRTWWRTGENNAPGDSVVTTNGVRRNGGSYTRFQPNPQKYESNAAKQRAYRERLKKAVP